MMTAGSDCLGLQVGVTRRLEIAIALSGTQKPCANCYAFQPGMPYEDGIPFILCFCLASN
jgi:hypothetical protein